MEIAQIVRELPPLFTLQHGSHESFEHGACLMEAVAYVAGEPHSDAPACASPILTSIAIRLNDRWDDEERQLLAPLIPRLVGTRNSREVDKKRAYVMVDASIREIAPLGLEAVGWRDLAARMRELATVVDVASAHAARKVCDEVRDECYKRRSASAASAAASAASAAAAYAYAAAADDADADADAYAYAYDAAAAAAAAADDAASASASAADAADDAAKLTPEDRARLRSTSRRPIIEASIRVFERAIDISE